MKATVPYIEQKFEGGNRQMFGGKLPKIPVELSDDGVPGVGRALPERQEPSPGVSFICISYLTKYLIQTMPSCSFTDLNFRRMGLRFLGRPSNAAAIPSRPSMP